MERLIPARYEGLYRRAMAKKSRKAAIRCFCLECCGWVAEEVERCTDTTCPLWRYREKG